MFSRRRCENSQGEVDDAVMKGMDGDCQANSESLKELSIRVLECAP